MGKKRDASLSLPGLPTLSGDIDRRKFVRTAGGILVAAGLGACGKDSFDPNGPTGTIRVNIAGLAAGAPSGGTVTAAPAGGGTAVTVTIPGTGTATAQVPAGTYNVSYTTPSGYQLASGTTVPSTVTITANQTTTITVALSPALPSAGTLQVTVTGLNGGALSGGTALATPTGGGANTTINIPPAGVVSTSLAAGSYSVSYVAPAGFTLAGGTTNPQTATVTASQTTNVTFAVTPSGTFQTPDIMNNASFETNWEGFCSAGFLAPDNCVRDTTRALPPGTTSVKRVLISNTGNAMDEGGTLCIPFYAGSPLNQYTPTPPIPAKIVDRLWTRWYFYLDAAWDGIFKFAQYESDGFSDVLNTLYFFGDSSGPGSDSRLGLFLTPEITTDSINSHVTLSSLVGAWHWVEVDYWRNGDLSNGGQNYPSMAVWLDGIQWNNDFSLPPPASWLNGRINFGKRASSVPIGVAKWLGTLNNQTGSFQANIWVDRIAISSVGRIGP